MPWGQICGSITFSNSEAGSEILNDEYTGCLIKNASTHNFFIYYPISMNKKTEDMVFHALGSSYKIFFFGDSQLFFFKWTYVVF
jgi:hypothetical protein